MFYAAGLLSRSSLKKMTFSFDLCEKCILKQIAIEMSKPQTRLSKTVSGA